MVALAAIAAGQFYPFLDPLGGFLVSLLILRASYEVGHDAFLEMIDRGLDSELLGQINKAAQKGLGHGQKESPESGKSVHLGGIKATKSGSYYIVDLGIEGPGSMTLETFEKFRRRIVESVQEEVASAKIVRVSITTQNI